MKKIGSTSDFTEDRDRELHQSFMHVLKTAEGVPLRDMFALAANRPTSRFWVSETRAVAVISGMMRGEDMGRMYPKRREMYEEILRRVSARMAADPTLCLTHAVNEVVYEEAPEFYMTPGSVRVIVYRIRRRARAMRMLRAKIEKTMNKD